MTYRYTYKIICTHPDHEGCYYYGARITKTEPEKDKYKGSGKDIQQYHKLYPDCYKKVIIGLYDTDEELRKSEYELIHSHLNDPKCLNLKEGGVFPDLVIRNKISDTLKDRKLPPEHYKHVCEGNKGKNKNRPCPEHQKQILSEYNKGIKFLTKDGHTVRVKGDDIEYYLSRGYHYGMK